VERASDGDIPTVERAPGPELIARARADEVARQADAVRESAIVNALLEWLDGLVLVLNAQRQIVAVSETFLHALGFRDSSDVIGMRLGEAMGCVYPPLGADGCSTSESCRHCGSLNAILESIDHRTPTQEEFTVTSHAGASARTRKYLARVTPIEVGGQRFSVVLLQRPTTQPSVLDDVDEDAASEWPGALRRFTRVRQLGTGGMGTVFLVFDERARPFALKFVQVPERASPRYAASVRQRFQVESEVGLNLHHANIVRVFESGATSEGTLYFVSEFCPYGSTSTFLQRLGAFAVDAALFWMIGAARGLDHAWKEHRIVHRDIKPDNLLIGDGFLLKIADFGIARRTAGKNLALTTPGMVIGSARYMAPEQAYTPDEVDNRTDLYSLGATFYHLLCGVPPFTGANAVQIMMHHAETPLVPLSLRRPHVPTELAEVIDALLAKRRQDRPADAGEVLAQLDTVARKLGVDPDRVPEIVTLLARTEQGEGPTSWSPDASPSVPASTVGVTGQASSAPTTREPRRGKK
jgi:serine/threonine protein kinase